MLIATSVVGGENIQRDSHLKQCLVGPFTSRDQVDAAQLPAMDRDFDLVPVIVTGQGAEPDTELLLYVLRKLGMEVVCAEAPSYCGHLMQHGCLDACFMWAVPCPRAPLSRSPGRITPMLIWSAWVSTVRISCSHGRRFATVLHRNNYYRQGREITAIAKVSSFLIAADIFL